jgi:hypothetical protein
MGRWGGKPPHSDHMGVGWPPPWPNGGGRATPKVFETTSICSLGDGQTTPMGRRGGYSHLFFLFLFLSLFLFLFLFLFLLFFLKKKALGLFNNIGINIKAPQTTNCF